MASITGTFADLQSLAGGSPAAPAAYVIKHGGVDVAWTTSIPELVFTLSDSPSEEDFTAFFVAAVKVDAIL